MGFIWRQMLVVKNGIKMASDLTEAVVNKDDRKIECPLASSHCPQCQGLQLCPNTEPYFSISLSSCKVPFLLVLPPQYTTA